MNEITWVAESLLGFGAIGACACARAKDKAWAVVHACKDPCHRGFVGYRGNLPGNHPHYLAAEHEGNLYMNLIDPPLPLFRAESFSVFFDFVDRHLHQKPVVIHCNRGESRAPSLALLVMAKRLAMLPDEDYDAARVAFAQKFPYKPGGGISRFLAENWELLGR